MPSAPARNVVECTAANHKRGSFVTIRITTSDHIALLFSITEEYPGSTRHNSKTIAIESLSSQSKLAAVLGEPSLSSCYVDLKGYFVWVASTASTTDPSRILLFTPPWWTPQNWTVLRGDSYSATEGDNANLRVPTSSRNSIENDALLWYITQRPPSWDPHSSTTTQWIPYGSSINPSNPKAFGNLLAFSIRPQTGLAITSQGYVIEWPIPPPTPSPSPVKPSAMYRLENLDPLCLDSLKSRLYSAASQHRFYLLCLQDNSKTAQLYEPNSQWSRKPFNIPLTSDDPTRQPSLAALSISNKEDRLVLKNIGADIHLRYIATDGFERVWDSHLQPWSMRRHLHARQDNSTANGGDDGTSSGGTIGGAVVAAVFIAGLTIYCIFFRRKRNEMHINKILEKYNGQPKSSPSLAPLNDDYIVRPAPLALHTNDYEHESEDQEQIALQRMQIEAHSNPHSVVLASSSLAPPMAPPQPYAPGHEYIHQTQDQHHHSSPLQSIPLDTISLADSGWPSSSSVQHSPVVMATVPGGYTVGNAAMTPPTTSQYYGLSPHVSSSVSVPDVANCSKSTLQPPDSITLYEMTEKERLRHQVYGQQACLQPGEPVAHHNVEGNIGGNILPPPPYLQKVEATLQEPSAPVSPPNHQG